MKHVSELVKFGKMKLSVVLDSLLVSFRSFWWQWCIVQNKNSFLRSLEISGSYSWVFFSFSSGFKTNSNRKRLWNLFKKFDGFWVEHHNKTFDGTGRTSHPWGWRVSILLRRHGRDFGQFSTWTHAVRELPGLGRRGRETGGGSRWLGTTSHVWQVPKHSNRQNPQ